MTHTTSDTAFSNRSAMADTIGTTGPPFRWSTETTAMADRSYIYTPTPSVDTVGTTAPPFTGTTGMADTTSTPSVDTPVTTELYSTETTAMADSTSILSVDTTGTTGPYSTRTTRMTDSLFTTQTTVSPAFSSTQGKSRGLQQMGYSRV
ncbi:uncharacterized protein LOC118425720 isoform X2 [Branchiostoma floridae]|uniref:Uncharacterized protein LOC118425720 isoform X2 n=1 Tax=Branchiostoma floridae TaxID=7739 RepID=A0A9J7N5M0_BRAFL|nr:uncharacterized protein LOC118425720 isoform X2 [Branchiostoma floridae]